MIPRSSSPSNSQYPSMPFIFVAGLRYTLTGNNRGNRRSAQYFSRRTNFLRQSGSIGQPHNQQPLFAVPAVQNDRDLRPGITHGLGHPPIGIARLAPLHLQVQVFMGRNHIRRLPTTGKLLATAGGSAHDPGPFLAGFQFATLSL